jgi:hypothetical protein
MGLYFLHPMKGSYCFSPTFCPWSRRPPNPFEALQDCASVGKALSVAWQPVIQPLVPSLLIPHSRQIIGEAYQSIAGGDLRITGLISQSIRPGRRQPHGGHVKTFSHSSLVDSDCRNIIQNSRMTARRSAKQSFIELELR